MPSKPRTQRVTLATGHGEPPVQTAYDAELAEVDMINHPPHYKTGARCPGCERPIECIDVIESMPFTRGSAMKYLWRAGVKGDTIEDLSKAIWFINREISTLNKAERGTP